MQSIQIEQNTFDRLLKNIRAFGDTPDTVINRGLDALEGDNQIAPTKIGNTMLNFGDKNLPNLTHTKILYAKFDGKELPKVNWNSLLDLVLVAARKCGLSISEIKGIGGINIVEKKKFDEGFRHLESAGFSVQGQDSNRACFGALAIGRKIGMSVEIEFVWREKDGASHPGKTGRVSNV